MLRLLQQSCFSQKQMPPVRLHYQRRFDCLPNASTYQCEGTILHDLYDSSAMQSGTPMSPDTSLCTLWLQFVEVSLVLPETTTLLKFDVMKVSRVSYGFQELYQQLYGALDVIQVNVGCYSFKSLFWF